MPSNSSVSKKNIPKKASEIILSVIILIALFLLLIYSETAVNYMKKGLVLCATAIIPSLFPFMIISELLIRSGIGQKFSRLFRLPMRLIFGIGDSVASAFILGSICGFPIGALTLVKMLDSGEINKRELERMMTFCNIPSAAFVISTLGASLLGDIRLVILIYSCLILSSFIIGISCRFIYKKDAANHVRPLSANLHISANDFTSSIQASAISMLNVCAYVVFFLTLVGCLGTILESLTVPAEITALLFGIFEISSGVGESAALQNRMLAVVMCALIAGWSGLSVHFQIMSCASGRNISFKPFFIAKALQGLLCAVLTFAALKLIPSLLFKDSTVFLPSDSFTLTLWDAFSLSLFSSALTTLTVKRVWKQIATSVLTKTDKK